MLSPVLLAVGLLTALIALVPARRLFVRGYSAGLIATYFVGVWLVGLLVAIGPGRSRLFVPILLILYFLPFVTVRSGLDRLFGRGDTDQPRRARNVTPRPGPGETSTDA